ncbi:MAG: hypothetical protein ACM3L8_02820 [Verrucomicrobiota bacterium]
MGSSHGRWLAILVAAGIATAVFGPGCAKKDINQEVVATVNGDKIKVVDVREYFGVPGGIFALPSIPADQKKKAIEQMVAGRLLVQEGRALGLDNTDEYRETVKRNEVGVRINALFRKVASEKLKLDDKEVQAEAAKIRKENPGVSEADATARASKVLIDRQVRQIQKDLVATARKETRATIDNAVISQIGKGSKVQDNAVLATAGDEKILYGDVKKMIREMPNLPIMKGMQTPEQAAALINNILEQELTVRALIAYSKMQGIDGSEWYRTAQQNMERSVIANMTFDKISLKDPPVSDKEIADDYARRVKMMPAGGQKPPPLAAVKEQLRGILKNEKRREAFEEHIEGLRKKAKVTVVDAVIAKV